MTSTRRGSSHGSSSQCAENQGDSCGMCGGTVDCDGHCSVSTPGDYGSSCGSCGGTVQCNGACSVSTPSGFGDACGSCGGTVQCDGACSVATPGNFGEACGSCGGNVQCDGACSVATPGNFGEGCGSCGGTIQCDSQCSVTTPANFGQSCNSCGGTYGCSSDCTGPSPTSFSCGDLGTFDLDFNSGNGCSDGVLYAWSPPITNANPGGTYTCTYQFTGENNLGDTSGDIVLYMGCTGAPFQNAYSEDVLQNNGVTGEVTCDVGTAVTAFVAICDESGGCCGDPSINIDITGCSGSNAACN